MFKVLFSQAQQAYLVLNESMLYAHSLNPAYLINNSDKEISVFPFTNFNVEVYLPFSLNGMFSKSSENENYLLDFQKMSKRAHRRNSLYLNSNFDWFSFSVSNNNFNWNITIEDRIIGGLGFNDHIIDFINLGNNAFLNENVNMKISVSELHFRSFNFTWAQTINKRIDMGFAVKLYFGKSLMDLKSEINIYTDQNVEYVDINVEGDGKVSFPILLQDVTGETSNNQSVSKYLFGNSNPGYGIDFGLTYQLNNDTKIMASLNDFGFVYWNTNTTLFETIGSYRWEGVNISGKLDLQNLGSLKENNAFIDFQERFLNRLIVPSEGNFYSFMPLSINSAITHNYSKTIDVSALVHTQFLPHFFRGNVSLLASLIINKSWKVTTGLSFSNHSYFNIPSALVFNDDKLSATLTVGNLWGLFLPTISNYQGGGFNLSYRFAGKKSQIKKVHADKYPFYSK